MTVEHWLLLWSLVGLSQIFPIRRAGKHRYKAEFRITITKPSHFPRYILAGPFVWFTIIGCCAAVALGWMENHPDED